MKCIILAGGGGLRLWPLSRQKYPKQFLKIGTENTMFQETVRRNSAFSESFMVVTNDEFRFIVEQQMNWLEVDEYTSVLETVGRNTAPAITIAALLSDPEEILFVVPADAKIISGKEYEDAVNKAMDLAAEGNIVTFGITPSMPHTGYGYIKYEGADVKEFKEKPDLKTAEGYLAQGGYLWNSGMFMFRAGVFLEEMKKYRKDIYDACVELSQALEGSREILLPKELLEKIPAESVDYAVMEKSEKMKVVKSDFYWNDIGGFEALCQTMDKDGGQNSKHGNNIIMNECGNVSVINEAQDRLVIVNHLQDAIVINTNDAVYITREGSSAEIKNIIEKNKQEYGEFFDSTIRSYRPWGYYEVLINHPGYKVKKITVYPGKRLSLQKHFYRSEHWTVVEGIATITLGNNTSDYAANESAYIPIGEIHRVANNTERMLSIIEIALGEKVVEEDIVRFEDDYGR